jgi:hypothetical protein
LLPQLTIISYLILVFSFTEVRQLTYPRAYEYNTARGSGLESNTDPTYIISLLGALRPTQKTQHPPLAQYTFGLRTLDDAK